MRKALAIAIAAVALGAATPALAQDHPPGDAAAGEKTFRQCAACHNIGVGAKNKIGPELNGVLGRKPGSVEGFAYSPAMKKFGETHTWDDATLYAYLENPRKMVVGTKMAFAGLRKPEDRANVVAYIESFNADGSKK